MYGKLFASMYDGTLYGKWQALVTFQQMVILSTPDGIVDMTSQNISGRTSIPLEIIEAGVSDLEAPDPHSRTPDHEGRRIIRLDAHRPWGWQIVNHKKYKELIYLEQKREADRERIRQKRASPPVAECRNVSRRVADVAHTDTDAYTDSKKKNVKAGDPPWFIEFKSLMPKRAGDMNWRGGLRGGQARITEGHKPEEFMEGARRYHEFCRITDKIGTEFVMQASRFLGPGKPFLQPWDPPGVKAPNGRKGTFDQLFPRDKS
jgi:hypothetical protein